MHALKLCFNSQKTWRRHTIAAVGISHPLTADGSGRMQFVADAANGVQEPAVVRAVYFGPGNLCKRRRRWVGP